MFSVDETKSQIKGKLTKIHLQNSYMYAIIMIYICDWMYIMEFSESIKQLRTKCLLSQEDFAKEIGVSFSTVNRWEMGRTKPTFKAMKRIADFCQKNNQTFDFTSLGE